MSVNNAKKKVIIAISGGVDSAVSAYLLKQQGYDLVGVFMRLFADNKRSEMYARQVCEALDIRFYPINLVDKFQSRVVDYFLDTYMQGATPNPCVRCNHLIKFQELLRVRAELGADLLATGHYMRIKKEEGIYNLYKAEDKEKDQSYFLYNLNQADLARVIFPLAKYQKEDVKKIAIEQKLPSAKAESQDICFLITDGKIVDHNDYLRKHLELKSGEIRTLDEKVIGRHDGLPLYTIGQRRGVEVGGTGPYYVARFDYDKNILYVVNDGEDPALYTDSLELENANWIVGEPEFPFQCEGVIRYRHPQVFCTVQKRGDKLKVKFEKAQRAVTRGQSVVFYEGDRVIGGGMIK